MVPPRVALNVEERLYDGLHQKAHRAHHDGRRDDVLHVLGQPGDETAPRTHGRARERVSAARVRESGRHLGDAEAEAVVHHRDEKRCDQEPPKAAHTQAEVPAVEVA